MNVVSVVGLAPGTVPLADIGMDVPHGVVVHIPADKASNSKDLWRAINQRSVFRLQAGPNALGPIYVAPPDEGNRLREQVVTLERTVMTLEAALTAKTQELLLERSKFDQILDLLRSGVPFTSGAVSREATPTLRGSGLVEVDTPTFIPSTIKGGPSESRVTVQEGEGTGDSISGARTALRKLRRNE